MPTVAENSLRKAAVFLRSLDRDAAASMLGRLSADEARALRAAVAALDGFDDHERDAVVTAMRGARRQSSADGTVELALSDLEPPARQATETTFLPPRDGADWARSLRDADPRAIADYLAREQPRAVAAVLGYLPAELGAAVLQRLPADERRRVVAQLARQGEADPDSLRVIAAGLTEWVRRQREDHERRSMRVATIRQIVAATPESERRDLLAGLSEFEPEVAASLADLAPRPEPAPQAQRDVKRLEPTEPGTISLERPPTPSIPLEDLVRVDGRALAAAVATLPPRAALLALAGAPKELVDRLANGLPRHVARDLRGRLNRVGPTTLAEIDRAQQLFAEAVAAIIRRRSATQDAPAGGR